MAQLLFAAAGLLCITSTHASAVWQNSVGMKFVSVPAGSYVMGESSTPLPTNLTRSLDSRLFGDFDEQPYAQVNVATLNVSLTEVTNAQYEEFDPEHKKMRGKMGFSTGPDEAVIFVTWQNAVDFASWLTKKEAHLGRFYRLPTEIEWEYFARAGTTTYFNTGDTYPYGKNQQVSWYPGRPTNHDIQNLTVAEFPPNPWGLYDTHGNVEEWCQDFYVPHPHAPPSGMPTANDSNWYRVTRGGSHSTELYYLRSANRMATHPQDSSWYIGFRLVEGTAAATARSPTTPKAPSSRPVAPSSTIVPRPRLSKHQLRRWQASPVFLRPIRYVHVETPHALPFTHHNHDPALVACPDGSVFSTWFSTIEEAGRESGIVHARLPLDMEYPGGSHYEALEAGMIKTEVTADGTVLGVTDVARWPLAETFSNIADRMENAPDMWFDNNGTLFHVHGVSAAATWGNNILMQRHSEDCGRTWSTPRIVEPNHGLRNQPVNTVVQTANGTLFLPCDNNTRGDGGTALHRSDDGGLTWSTDPATGSNDILGIHGTAAVLSNGSLLAFGRGNDINGMMAQSRSDDWGRTWTYSPSTFPGIHGGQRGILLRLQEGPLMMCTFANDPGMAVPTACGQIRSVVGLYCALSHDQGNTWPQRRLVSDDRQGTVLEALDANQFVMGFATGEPDGYCTARQGADGMVHLISSRQHYRFNAAWLQQAAPCEAVR